MKHNKSILLVLICFALLAGSVLWIDAKAKRRSMGRGGEHCVGVDPDHSGGRLRRRRRVYRGRDLGSGARLTLGKQGKMGMTNGESQMSME